MRTISLEKEAFNSKQACDITGITNKQLVHWDSKGLVKPSVRPAAGRGSQRLYSYADLLALGTVKSLRDQGVSLQKVRRCVLYLRRHLPDVSQPLNFCTLISDGHTVYLIEDEQTLLDTVRNQGQRAFLQLSIAELDRHLRSCVLRLTAKRVEEVTVGDETYQVEVEPDMEGGGYIATVAGLPGCVTDGDTLEEVLQMADDAIRCWLEAHEELKGQGVEVPIRAHGKRRKRA